MRFSSAFGWSLERIARAYSVWMEKADQKTDWVCIHSRDMTGHWQIQCNLRPFGSEGKIGSLVC